MAPKNANVPSCAGPRVETHEKSVATRVMWSVCSIAPWRADEATKPARGPGRRPGIISFVLQPTNNQ